MIYSYRKWNNCIGVTEMRETQLAKPFYLFKTNNLKLYLK